METVGLYRHGTTADSQNKWAKGEHSSAEALPHGNTISSSTPVLTWSCLYWDTGHFLVDGPTNEFLPSARWSRFSSLRLDIPFHLPSWAVQDHQQAMEPIILHFLTWPRKTSCAPSAVSTNQKFWYLFWFSDILQLRRLLCTFRLVFCWKYLQIL